MFFNIEKLFWNFKRRRLVAKLCDIYDSMKELQDMERELIRILKNMDAQELHKSVQRKGGKSYARG